MMKRLLLLTGNPGVGKTTVLMKTAEVLGARGHSVGGMISREIRGAKGRIGFEVLDLASGKRGWLAHVKQRSGPRLSKYYVSLADLENVGANAINDAVKREDVIVIDEIGPMELLSSKFKEAVEKAVESKKLMIGVVHGKAKDRLIDLLRTREDAETIVVTFENRNSLQEIIIKKALEFLENV
jgi:nucleoside-triphosphatase